MSEKPRVLIFCTGNSTRSQMAVGLLRHLGNDAGGHFEVESDGTRPAGNARETCPIYPGHANRLHHSLDDPAAVEGSEDDRLAAFRRVRDEIRNYLRGFPQATRKP